MQTVTIAEITERLRKLPAEKLVVVYDFVSYLSERELGEILRDTTAKTIEFALASEAVLGRNWNRPEEDAAWAGL
ncbi:MAG: hypothetical protein RMK99_14355 [Anaerolineales bacterium]|nr:hypothetical protein [Anaerolineales bacterium]